MRFFVCPKCACVNKAEAIKCAGCGVPSLAIIMFPNLQWLEFKSVNELDNWLKRMKRMGSKLWRKD